MFILFHFENSMFISVSVYKCTFKFKCVYLLLQTVSEIELRQKDRQKLYQDYCNNHNINNENTSLSSSLTSAADISQTSALSSFQGNIGNYRPRNLLVADKYKFLYCRIPKVGISNWKRLIIHMNTNMSLDKLRDASKLHKEFTKHYIPELSSEMFSQKSIEKRLEQYLKVAFVRHPLERLLSGYEDKFNRTANVTDIYVRESGLAMLKLCRNGFEYTKNWRKQVDEQPITFEEFLCYASRAPAESLNIHWKPYNKICDFCHQNWRFDFIGQYENIAEEANYLLDTMGFTGFRFPAGYRSNVERQERFVRVYASISPQIIDAVYKSYQPDFELFGYKLYPDFWYTMQKQT